MPQQLDAPTVRRWALWSAQCLAAQAERINALNVFPVPDADTGSNLALTAAAAAELVAPERAEHRPGASSDSAAEVLRAWAQGAVVAARGNSGVILGQYLAGFAEGARTGTDAAGVAAGLRSAASRARAAVTEPAPGTILTVAEAAAQAESTSLPALAQAAATLARAALRATTHQLPALARAGVVDAGGAGLVVVLEALVDVLSDAEQHAPARLPGHDAARAVHPSGQMPGPHERAGFEVQYLLAPLQPGTSLDPLRQSLAALGESVTLGPAPDGSWSVHVHVPESAIGAAIEAGLALGRPSGIAVSALPVGSSTSPAPPEPASAVGTAVLALVPLGALAAVFGEVGAQVLTAEAVGVDELVAAVGACASSQVIVLPNGAVAAGVAAQAAGRSRSLGCRTIVVPTQSLLQGLAALAVHDPGRDLDEDVVAMAEAAAGMRCAEVIRAEHEALTSVGRCDAGDLLGLIDGEVVEIGLGLVPVGFALLDRLLGVGAELITLVLGAQAPPGTGEVLRRHVEDRAPLTEVTLLTGGHSDQLLLIGAE